jgi:hypothetical protein
MPVWRRCGEPKDSKKTLCSRMDLYQRMGEGYEEAYERVSKFLDSLKVKECRPIR